jgi:hypothetical protein
MPDISEIRVFDETRPKRVKRGALACATILLVGMIVDALAVYHIPELLLDSFWIGRPEQPRPPVWALAFGGIWSLIVPFCMYFGAVRESKFCLCYGACHSWCFCLLMMVVIVPMFHLVLMIPTFESGLDKVQAYYGDCDPKWCCDVSVTELTPGVLQAAACDDETGLPFAEYEEAYLDCLLGADPDYVRSLQVNPRNIYLASDPPEDYSCKWSLLYLTECEGRYGDEFKVYTNNWAYDMKEALNSSLKEENLTLVPPIMVGPEDNKTAWKRIPVPVGWEPSSPQPETARRADGTEMLEEEIATEGASDVSQEEDEWAKFGDDLEKFNWTKLETNPKNPGPFKFKHLFRSSLDHCVYRPEALEDATKAHQEYVPNLKIAVSTYIVAAFLVVLCGIFISAYSCVVSFHLCCVGKKEHEYHGLD